MINIENLLNKPIGSRITIDSESLGFSQKQLSAELQKRGWKKDYNYKGEWVRRSEWEYLSYYQSRKMGIPYARLQFKKHEGDATEIKNNQVKYYCGMPIDRVMIDIIMKSFGYTLEKDVWRKI